MKIIILGPFPPFRGGISDFNLALAQNLKIKHEVENVNFTTQYPAWLFPGKTQYKPDNDEIGFNTTRLLSSINFLTWKKTANYIVDKNPDLVIFRYWMPFFALSQANVAKYIRSKCGTKMLAICDNIVPHEKHIFDYQLTQYFLNKMDHFIVMSRMVEKDLLKFIDNPDYRYTPHPIYNIFGPPVSKAKARQTHGIKSKNIILFFGIIRAYKGLDILLKSIPFLAKNMSDFKVLIVGESYEPFEKYQNLINELEIEKYLDLKLQFLSNDEIAGYFSAADVVALPYRSATQSGIVQIAYYYDKPVIASNVGGLPEVVSDGEVGYVVNPEPADFADGIIRIFKNDQHLLFSENVKLFKNRFNWDEFVNVIESMTAK
ncbi:glycosyltransferase [Candidatus Neomarinimicrobiota bacterium]